MSTARALVAQAIRRGELTREPCVICGREPADGHHEDYAKPLDVIWLCRRHHQWLHRKHGTFAAMQDYYDSAAADRAAKAAA